jgi:hypothetical protein
MVRAMTYNVTLLPHPHLWTGIDEWGLALDEINGGGWNDPVETAVFDFSFTTTPMILNYPFVIENPEFCVQAERATFCVAWEPRESCVENVA